MKRLRTIFMGTPDFAIPSLMSLYEHTELALVVTQPDRRCGRGRILQPSIVKQKALELGVDVVTPAVVKGKKFAEYISKYKPDVLITAAFGRILGPSLLKVAPHGCLNVHASLLPAHRGAAPINWAIIKGDSVTGVSIMKTVQALDAGPVYDTAQVEILPDETTSELTSRLALLGGNLLVDVLGHLDSIEPQAQNEELATYAPILNKADGKISWDTSSLNIHNHIRGMYPWPGAFATMNGLVIKVHASVVLDKTKIFECEPGTVLEHSACGVDVVCQKGIIRLISTQLPNKKRLEASAFYAGCTIPNGTILV